MDSGSYCFDGTHLFESSEQAIVRTKFIPQIAIGAVPIAEIEFDVFNRHELIPILLVLSALLLGANLDYAN